MDIEKEKATAYKWFTLLTVSIHAFMGTLDSSIVNLSLPVLTKAFDSDPSVVVWVSVAYLLTSIGLMLIVGRASDVFGRKKVFVLGFILFTTGLFLCSFSQGIIQLILSRVVQGMGAAMTVGLGPAIVTAAFPDKERGKALGILGAALSSGILSGPVLGGFLLDTLGWRSVFYMRVPIGVIGSLVAWRFLKEQKGPHLRVKFDLGGAGSLFTGLVCLLLFFNLWGKSGFTTLPVLIMGSCAVVFLLFFIGLETRAEQPVVDLNLFKNSSFAFGNISLLILHFASASQRLVVPYYLINGIGYSPSKAGFLLSVATSIRLVVGPLSGWASDKIGSRLLCTVGAGVVCLSLFLLSTLGIDSSSHGILVWLILFAVGFVLFLSPNNSSIMGSVPKETLSTASATMATIRQIGSSFGLAIAGVIFTSRQLFHRALLTPDNPDPLMLDRLSLIGSYRDVLFFATLICCVGIYTSFAQGSTKKIKKD